MMITIYFVYIMCIYCQSGTTFIMRDCMALYCSTTQFHYWRLLWSWTSQAFRPAAKSGGLWQRGSYWRSTSHCH